MSPSGTSASGVGVTQPIEVNADLKMYLGGKMYAHAQQLNWTRKGIMPRPLFHDRERGFWPARAEGACVWFAEVPEGVEMEVTDGDRRCQPCGEQASDGNPICPQKQQLIAGQDLG